jgi:beta-glucosidase/6-phospho-beta-glucosidase/beta-galactosidase
MSKTQFTKTFLWGASTAAHQVEGNTHNQWDPGWWTKFGLVAVDRASMGRTIRPSAQWLAKQIIKRRYFFISGIVSIISAYGF